MTDDVRLTLEIPAGVAVRLAGLAAQQRRTTEAQAAWILETQLDRAERAARIGGRATPQRSQAAKELVDRLRALHMTAGRPSTRTIGRAVGFSHATVAETLNGKRIPAWPRLAAIVDFLGGEPEAFRAGWAATR